MNTMSTTVEKCAKSMEKWFTEEKYKLANEYLKICCLTSNKYSVLMK